MDGGVCLLLQADCFVPALKQQGSVKQNSAMGIFDLSKYKQHSDTSTLGTALQLLDVGSRAIFRSLQKKQGLSTKFNVDVLAVLRHTPAQKVAVMHLLCKMPINERGISLSHFIL